MGDGPLDDGDERLIGDQMNLTLGSELLTSMATFRTLPFLILGMARHQ